MNVHSPYPQKIKQNHRLIQFLFLESYNLKDLLNNYKSLIYNMQTIQSGYFHLLIIYKEVNQLK